MPEILSQLQKVRRITPETPEQFVALQVARALHDEEHAADYLSAAGRFPLATILVAYRVLNAYGPPADRISHHFRTVLLNVQGRGITNSEAQVLSLRIGRRTVAIAVFCGLNLELVRVRELPSDPLAAEGSAAAFISRVLDDLPGCTVALEKPAHEVNTRQAGLHTLALKTVRGSGSPLWLIESSELFQAFAHPGCWTRTQFREVVSTIRPELLLRFENRAVLDAVGLGLLIQAKRFLDEERIDENPECEK